MTTKRMHAPDLTPQPLSYEERGARGVAIRRDGGTSPPLAGEGGRRPGEGLAAPDLTPGPSPMRRGEPEAPRSGSMSVLALPASGRVAEGQGGSVHRIAVVRALHLGDLLLAIPALRALRAHFAGAEITLIGLPWAEELRRRFAAYIDRFLAFPGYPGICETDYQPRRTRRFLAAQRAYGYDLVIQMHGSGDASNPFALALGGRVTAGYYRCACPPGLHPAARYPDDAPEVTRNLGLARLVGCGWLEPTLEFPLLAADQAEAHALLEGAPNVTATTTLIGVHASAKAPARRWPPERFAAVADILAARFDATIVLTGSADDSAMTRAVRRHMRHTPLDLAGKTSLGALAALIARMSLFIGNDSGPAHLAEAVGTPSVTLFGPTDPRRWAPLDQRAHRIVRHPVGCSPCVYSDCPVDHRCLRRITAAEVITRASDLLLGEVTTCGA